jgi:hypothetical protein
MILGFGGGEPVGVSLNGRKSLLAKARHGHRSEEFHRLHQGDCLTRNYGVKNGVLRYFRWPYHANVMTMFEQIRRTFVFTPFPFFLDP